MIMQHYVWQLLKMLQQQHRNYACEIMVSVLARVQVKCSCVSELQICCVSARRERSTEVEVSLRAGCAR